MIDIISQVMQLFQRVVENGPGKFLLIIIGGALCLAIIGAGSTLLVAKIQERKYREDTNNDVAVFRKGRNR